MDTLTKRQKLHEFIEEADDETVDAMFIDIQEQSNDRYEWWNDEELVAELERRSTALKSGEDKGVTLEESRSKILARRSKHA